MWDLLPKKFQLTAILASGIIGARAYDAAYAWWTHKPPGLWSQISFATLIVGTILYVLAELLWRPIWQRVPYLKNRLFPYLNGTWEGSLISTWIDPATQQKLSPIPATFKIRQGLFQISVTMATGESGSYSTNAVLYRYPERDCFRVWYSYVNGPKQQVRWRSPPHDGVAYLEFDTSAKADHMTGRYFTERQTSGDIDLKRVSLEVGD